MAASIAKLNITLGADASGLGADINKGLAAAHRQITDFAPKIGAALTAGITGAVALMGKAFMDGVKHIDDLSAAASKLGTSTAALGALEHAAQLADTSFEGLLAGVEKLQATLALVSAGGNKAAAGALKFLKLDALDLRKLDVPQMILSIAKALEGVTEQSARMAAMRGLFGKGGGELINLLKRGVEGIKKDMEEAAILGLTIGENGAAAVGEFDNATVRLRNTWRGFGMQLAMQISPLMAGFSEKTVQTVNNMGRMYVIVKPIADTIAIMGTGAASLAQSFQLVVESVKLFGLNLARIWEGIPVGFKSIKQEWDAMVVNVTNGLKIAFTALFNEMVPTINKIGLHLKLGENIARTTAGLPPTPMEFLTPLGPPKLEPLPEKGHIDTSLFDQAGEKVDAQIKKMEGLMAENWAKGYAESYVKASGEIVQTGQQTAEKLMDVSDFVEEKTKKGAKDTAKEIKDAFADVHAANQNLILDMSMAWITGTGKFSDIINQWAQQTIRTFLSVMLFGRQIQSIGAGGAIETSTMGGILGGLGKFAVGLFGGPKQGGGPVRAGSAYRVGELGPEMFIPSNAGTIVPHRALSRAAGGGSMPIIVHQNFSPGVQQSHIAVLLDQLRAESKAGILAAVEEGGTFRRRLRT